MTINKRDKFFYHIFTVNFTINIFTISFLPLPFYHYHFTINFLPLILPLPFLPLSIYHYFYHYRFTENSFTVTSRLYVIYVATMRFRAQYCHDVVIQYNTVPYCHIHAHFINPVKELWFYRPFSASSVFTGLFLSRLFYRP